MEPRTVARSIALLRVVLGAAMLGLPERAAGGWVGPDAGSPGGRVLAEGLGARDLAVGIGTLLALKQDAGLRAWSITSAICDAADVLATLRARHSLAKGPVIGVTVLATTGAVAGAWLATKLD
jgi:hypothetical protein